VGAASDPAPSVIDDDPLMGAGPDMRPIFIVSGIVGIGALGALVAVLVARARRSPGA
jgi:hypothetical protein